MGQADRQATEVGAKRGLTARRPITFVEQQVQGREHRSQAIMRELRPRTLVVAEVT
jgi:hypothetical protein